MGKRLYLLSCYLLIFRKCLMYFRLASDTLCIQYGNEFLLSTTTCAKKILLGENSIKYGLVVLSLSEVMSHVAIVHYK